VVLGTDTLRQSLQSLRILLFKLENCTNPSLTPILVNAVGSNPANNEVLTVTRLGTTNKVASDCETCNKPYDGEIVDSVTL
jgi:hypothetical protein